MALSNLKHLSIFKRPISLYNKLRIYLNNSYWLFFDKLFTLTTTFFLSIVLARYLGPEQYGLFAYIISIASLFSIGAHLGLSGLLVKELVKSEKNEGVILGTALVMKFAGACLGFLFLLLYIYFVEKNSQIAQGMLFIASFTVFLSVFDLIDSWFNSKLNSKFVAIAHIITILFSVGLKVFFVINEYPLIYFIYAFLIEVSFLGILRIVLYSHKNKDSLLNWKFSSLLAGKFFKQGGLIFLGSIFAIIYLKIDLIMLRNLSSNEQVGIYAIASRLSEAFYIIPTVLMVSFYPKLIKLYSESKSQFILRIQQILDGFFLLALAISVTVIFISEDFISFAYGNDFRESASVLNIHILASLFIFMRAVFSKWIIIEDLIYLSLISQGLGALANCVLNFILIPEYGSIGASLATLVSYSVASYFVLIFFKDSWPMFCMMTKSIFSPFRLLKLLNNTRR